jgi:hypothetical protein
MRLRAAFAWTVIVFIGLLALPTYSNGATLFAVNGARAFLAAGIPILIGAALLAKFGFRLVWRCLHSCGSPE